MRRVLLTLAMLLLASPATAQAINCEGGWSYTPGEVLTWVQLPIIQGVRVVQFCVALEDVDGAPLDPSTIDSVQVKFWPLGGTEAEGVESTLLKDDPQVGGSFLPDTAYGFVVPSPIAADGQGNLSISQTASGLLGASTVAPWILSSYDLGPFVVTVQVPQTATIIDTGELVPVSQDPSFEATRCTVRYTTDPSLVLGPGVGSRVFANVPPGSTVLTIPVPGDGSPTLYAAAECEDADGPLGPTSATTTYAVPVLPPVPALPPQPVEVPATVISAPPPPTFQ